MNVKMSSAKNIIRNISKAAMARLWSIGTTFFSMLALAPKTVMEAESSKEPMAHVIKMLKMAVL
jgi:predicted metallopeptidase